MQIRDAAADPEYTMHRALRARRLPHDARGADARRRARPRRDRALARRVAPFDERTIELVTTFAAQGAIAIQNVQTARELEVASGHKSEFLASMSHELRTPLNAVIGFSDVLLEGLFGALNDRQEEYVRDIRESGRHLLELINEILDLSKVEAGRMELEPARAVAAGPDRAVPRAGARAGGARSGWRCRRTSTPTSGSVWADETKLKQVVLNLLSNAVKFTPEGGSVDVRALARRRRGRS